MQGLVDKELDITEYPPPTHTQRLVYTRQKFILSLSYEKSLTVENPGQSGTQFPIDSFIYSTIFRLCYSIAWLPS